MKASITLSFLFLMIAQFSARGQSASAEYWMLARKADSLYKVGDYKNSGFSYSAAFKSNGWTGLITDRYNAACSWALAGYPDSAFYQLDRITHRGNYSEYDHITRDPDLNSLHGDSRWQGLVSAIRENKERLEANLNKPLVRELDSIYTLDQEPRLRLDSAIKEFGLNSQKVEPYALTMMRNDSATLLRVMAILDKYGWPGKEIVGERGSLTLFLVIQHADLSVQKKYITLLREAVKGKKADASYLALLEDRVALREGRKQIYGSQVMMDTTTRQYRILPIEDEMNVNLRRASVGLNPLEEYLKGFGIEYAPPKK